MKILNFGSLNIDYVYSVDHFVNKGETLSSDGLHVYSGGKGLNQSIAMSRAGSGCDESGIGMTGGKSSSGMPGGENVLHQEAYKVQAVDTTAAGDTFAGYFLAQRMNGADVKQALAMASAASAIAVSRKGAAPSIPEREEAERSLRIFQQESCEAELNAENSGVSEESGSAAESVNEEDSVNAEDSGNEAEKPVAL